MKWDCVASVILTISCLLVLAADVACAKDEWKQPTEPVSKEVLTVVPGPKPECQDEIEVWGIGMNADKRKAEANALLDARRTACWHALMGGDGILNTSKHREEFKAVSAEFYAEKTVVQFVPWVSDILDRRKLEDKGRKVKVKARVVVDHCLIRNWLEDHGLEFTQSLASIMVLPDVPRAANPIEALEKDETKRMAKTVIENFMTSMGDFQLLEPKAELTIDEIQEATELLEDNTEDYVYRVALMHGADIYFRYEVMIETPVVQGQQMRKAVVRLDAYETATAAKLGSQTGYSDTRPASVTIQALTEEAISSGARDVLSRILEYWEKEKDRGTQYLVILAITDEADEDQAMDIQDCFVDCSDEISQAAKLDVMTQGRIKYRLWVDSKEIPDANRLWRAFRKCYEANCPQWKVRQASSAGHFFSGRIEAAE